MMESNHEEIAAGREDGCTGCAPHLHRLSEGELDPIREKRVREHLAACERCRGEIEEIEAERLWLIESALSSPALSESFSRKVIERIRAEEAAASRLRRRAFGLRLSGVAALVLAAVALGRMSPSLSPSGEEASGSPGEVVRTERNGGIDGMGLEEKGLTGMDLAAGHAAELTGSSAEIADDPDLCLDPSTDSHFRPVPAIQRGRRGATFISFGDVAGMAASIGPSGRLPPEIRDDPCKPDPNKDGQTDLNDVAYSCQILMGGPSSPRPLEEREKSVGEVDCEDLCLRA